MSQDIIFTHAHILTSATVVGRKEHQGPLGHSFDYFNDNDRFGQDTWEKAESEMQRIALAAALDKVKLSQNQVDMLFAGDLLNQCVGSSYGLLSYDIPYFGLYGACSTSVESILLASAMITGGHAKIAAAVTSSHNAAAERQFRTPLEYGGQRPPTGQWTVTGSGAFILCHPSQSRGRELATVVSAMPGIVVDMGITDANNMGAAMAPAARSVIKQHFLDFERTPSDYDWIITGDLGKVGQEILFKLLKDNGVNIERNHMDCGIEIFDAYLLWFRILAIWLKLGIKNHGLRISLFWLANRSNAPLP